MKRKIKAALVGWSAPIQSFFFITFRAIHRFLLLLDESEEIVKDRRDRFNLIGIKRESWNGIVFLFFIRYLITRFHPQWVEMKKLFTD